VANAGVLLALPAVIGEGLLSSAERIYAPLKAGFYGLHSILLCLDTMALLRIKTIKGLSDHQPGELGILLGLNRVPEVKTLRRKLAEFGGQHQAAKLAAALTEGQSVTYWLAECSVQVIPANRKRPAFGRREIRRLGNDGHQTAVLTTQVRH
jgi:hypothetical protein